VSAGEWDIQSDSEKVTPQERRVAQIVKHTKFDDFNNQNDLAILAVEVPFSFSPVVNTVCLPPPQVAHGSAICSATGWGATSDGEMRLSATSIRE